MTAAGQILIAERRNDDAIQILDEAVRAEPFNATAAYGLATAMTRAGRADDQTLEVQLRRNAQIELHIERVVMGHKRPRCGAPRYGLHHRCFYF